RAHQLRAEVAPNNIAAERQRQLGLSVPPLTHVGPEMQTAVAKGQLALVDQEPGIGFSRGDVVFDLIERHHDVARRGLIESEGEKRRSQLTGDGHQPSGERLPWIRRWSLSS